MQKCLICLHWYDDDNFLNDLVMPTCNDCAESIYPEEEEDGDL